MSTCGLLGKCDHIRSVAVSVVVTEAGALVMAISTVTLDLEIDFLCADAKSVHVLIGLIDHVGTSPL